MTRAKWVFTGLAVAASGIATPVRAAESAPIRIGGNVQQSKLVSQTPPVYPPEAKAAGIQGTVALLIQIDKDGKVKGVSVTSGPMELVQSAVDAVSKWVYAPTLLNGEPVGVITTVDVNYTLHQ